MKFEVLGKDKFRVTKEIINYAEKKTAKLVQMFDENEIVSLTVICADRTEFKKIEINLNTLRLKLRAEVKCQDFLEGIDLATTKLARQILKYKEKLSTYLHKESLAKIEATKKTDFDIRGLEKEILATQLVKSKQIELKPMSKEEAMLAMELIDHDFYIYYDIDLDKTCVLYRREDGQIAKIETNII